MTEKTVVLLGSLAVVGFALGAAAVHAPRLERRLAADAAVALAAQGLEVESRAAGRRIVLHGAVADEATRRRAVAAVADLPGVRGVADELEIEVAATRETRPFAPPSGASPAAASPPALDLSPPDRQAELDGVVAGRQVDFRKYGEELTPQAEAVVADVADYLVGAPGVVLEIAGHTDARGDLEVNYEISRRRAETVRRALVEQGVDGSRLSAVGRGPEQPIADNATEAGRRANRRVEFRVVEAGG